MRTGTIILLAAIAVIAAIGLFYMVDVEQTQQARLPDVDVQVEGGQMPKADVRTGSIQTGEEDVTITVPTIEVTPPAESNDG